MVIKLFEQYPVISVNEARILGQMKGVILQDNYVAAILAAFESEDELYLYARRNDINKYIQIPMEELIIGPDAFLIKKSSIANIYFTDGQVIQRNMDIYTYSGEFVGRVTGVEIGSDYILQGIHIEGDYIEAERIFKIGGIIIIDSDIDEETSEVDSENSEIFLNPEQEENDENTINQMISEEDIRGKDIEETEDIESEKFVPVLEAFNEELNDVQSDAVFSRYRYLLGKKLINSITVADKIYSDDSIITPKLIETAINNNCILSLIMNAED